MNLVAGFQALGTLMAVGLMMLPAAAARFWVRELWTLSAASSALAFASGFLGLLLSYHLDLPSGPSIVLVAGLAFCVGTFRPARQFADAVPAAPTAGSMEADFLKTKSARAMRA